MRGLRLSEREKTLLLVLILACLVLVFNYYVYRPIQQRVAELEAQAEEKQESAQMAMEIESNPAVYHEKIAKAMDEAAPILKMLPKYPQESVFVNQIGILASETGLKVQQVEPSKPVAESNYYRIPVKIVLKGKYDQILNFLQALDEDPPRLLHFRAWNLNLQQDGAYDLTLEVDIFAASERTSS